MNLQHRFLGFFYPMVLFKLFLENPIHLTCIDKNQRLKLIVRCGNNEIIKSTTFGIFHPQLLFKLFWLIFDMNLHHVEKFWPENLKTQKLCKKSEFQYFKLYDLVHSKKNINLMAYFWGGLTMIVTHSV